MRHGGGGHDRAGAYERPAAAASFAPVQRPTNTVGALVLAVALGAAGRAEAGELQVDAAANLRTSTWRGDFGGGLQVRLGYRFAEIIALDTVIWEELSSVDTRLNTGLTLGATGFLRLEPLRLSLRAYFVHQHEEAMVSVAENPFGALFGIGAGIRHRAGGGGTLGVEIPIDRSDNMEIVIVASTNFTVLAEDILGPQAYFGISGGIGFNYIMPGMP